MNNMNITHLQENVLQKRNYSKIPLKKKLSLITMVYRRRRPLQEAIAELGLKKTTAVNIIKKYKETGSFPMRKFKRTKKTCRKQVRERIPQLQHSQCSSSQRMDQIKVEVDEPKKNIAKIKVEEKLEQRTDGIKMEEEAERRTDLIKVEEGPYERMEMTEQMLVQPIIEEPCFFNNWAYMPLYFYSYT